MVVSGNPIKDENEGDDACDQQGSPKYGRRSNDERFGAVSKLAFVRIDGVFIKVLFGFAKNFVRFTSRGFEGLFRHHGRHLLAGLEIVSTLDANDRLGIDRSAAFLARRALHLCLNASLIKKIIEMGSSPTSPATDGIGSRGRDDRIVTLE